MSFIIIRALLALGSQSKMSNQLYRFQFTWNNYCDDDQHWLRRFASSDCKYMVFGREVGVENTPHLQGFVILNKKQRLTALKKKGFNAHFTPNDKKVDCAINYCKKDGDFEEIGDVPAQGKRADLEEFKTAVKAGIDWVTLLDEHSDVLKKYRSYCSEYYANYKPKPDPPDDFVARDWHQLVQDAIDNKCKRYIHFFVDEKGNAGKSYLTRQLFCTRDDVQIFKPEKEANLALMLDESKSVFIFDVPRSRSNMDIPFPYQLLEGLKDGLLVSGKYESRMKFPKVPNTVIIFANTPPDTTTLSADRYKVWGYIPKLKTYGPCVANATESWDLLHPVSKARLKLLENASVEKVRRKRARESIQDELLAIRLKKEENFNH